MTAAPQIESASSSRSSSSSSSGQLDRGAMLGNLRKMTVARMNCLENGAKATAIIGVICVVVSIALGILAFLDYVQPLTVLYPIGGLIVALVIAKVVDSCQRKVAASHNAKLRGPKEQRYAIHPDKWFAQMRKPPKRDEKKKK